MIGKWYIDGIDIWAQFRIGIANGGFNDLFSFPSFKSPDVNDWHEYDGVEVELYEPKLQNKQVNITFSSDTNSTKGEFISLISSPGYHKLTISSLNRSWLLRAVEENNNEFWTIGQTRAFRFFDDNPREIISGEIPSPLGHGFNLPKSDYSIDGVRFDEYGIAVEKIRSEIFKMPPIRSNLERNTSVVDGKEVSTKSANFKQKNVQIDCAFYCNDIDVFWVNYKAFFNMLVRPGERFLSSEEVDTEYPCYYGGSNGFAYLKKGNGYVLCKFTLNLIFTSYVVDETEYLLATEYDDYVVMEDDVTYIDLNLI